MRDVIKAAYLEELRFAKRQQWTITGAVIALIAGAYSIAHPKQPLGLWEKYAIADFIWIVVAGGCWLLYRLQRHLRNTRLVIDRDDTNPWRDADIVIGMAIALISSAAAVWYLLSSDGTYHLLLRMQE